MRAAIRGSSTISAANSSPCDHRAKAFASRAYSNAAFAYGRAMVARSAMSDLGRQFVEQLGVSSRVDFALQQARCALHGELAHFLAQAFAGARTLARRFVARLGQQTLRLGGGRALGLVDHLVRALAGLVQNLRRPVARLAQDFLGARLGFGQVLFTLGGGGQTGGDLL